MKTRMLALLLPLLAIAATAATADPRPRFALNIIVIMADDLGHADVGFTEPGSRRSFNMTPNLVELAAEGIRLDRFYTQPLCAPTRAAFLTGDLPGDYAYRSAAIPPSTPTLARRLQKAGYQTALVGKWHLGEVEESHPNLMGFDHFYGHLGGAIDYFNKFGPHGHDWQRNGTEIFEDEYATTLLGKEAARYIEERDPSAPFFLYLAFNAPHLPAQAPADLIEKFRRFNLCGLDDTESRCAYIAQVAVMDTEIGRVLRSLRTEDIEDETLVVFLSDNGGLVEANASNLPFRKRKLTTFEGGIRVPALARWSGVIAPGSSSDQVIRVQDLWRTLEKAANLKRRAPRESANIWPTLRHGYSADPRVVFTTSRPPECHGCFIWPLELVHSSLIDGDWKITKTYRVDPMGDVVTGTGGVELYHLREDPRESYDLSEVEPAVLSELQRKLHRWEWHDQRWAHGPLQCRERPSRSRRSQRGHRDW